MNSCSYNLRPADWRFQRLVNDMTQALKMHSIKVYKSDTDNACATMLKHDEWGRPTEPIITYNPDFIDDLWGYSEWAVVAVFAHEVAHHYNRDLHGGFLGGLRYNRQSHRQELNADWFMGWMLRCKGASLNQAAHLYQVMDMPGSYSHPPKYRRIQSMKDGWSKAHCQLPPPRRITRQRSTFGQVLAGVGLALGTGIMLSTLFGD